MFDFLNNMGGRAGDLFKVEGPYTPETPMSSPDAIKTGSALSDLGYFGQNGESEFSLPNSVKAFQDAQGLKVDGVINMGGPTEQAISSALAEQKAEPLASNVKVTQTADKSYQASASFQAKPDTNIPQKSKAEMDKLWEQVEDLKKPKTTQQALQGLLDNKLYQKKDPAYLKHVKNEFKRAYPGDVAYDETGKMIPPKAVLRPDQIKPFGMKSDAGDSKENLSAQTPDNKMARPKNYSKETAALIRQKRHAGLEEDAFEDMLHMLMNDPEGFAKLPEEDKAAYRAYQMKKRKFAHPNRKPHEEAQVTRNAIKASREAGAGSYIVSEAKQAFFNTTADAAHGALVLSGGDAEQLEGVEKTRQRKMRENHVPSIYKGKTAGKYVEDLVNINPIQGALSNAGKISKDLEKMGVSRDGQQIGAVIMGLTSLAGTNGVKLGAGEIKDLIANRFGKNWSKRLLPKDVEVLNDQLIGQGIQVGTKNTVEGILQEKHDREY
ncbi:hypothetical protein RYZ26_19120 [Terasakiella sp. A23]|uniref:hypothetical protein n=1 Tax=Terasakiella sp. FCG-A23 TaxID=3080561 RepID=UPI002953E39B|nr:hypothetical protein [Terasakiella sp. A23]MDV7341721.1 hypothetical protein [Terasakiella sp. A23]